MRYTPNCEPSRPSAVEHFATIQLHRDGTSIDVTVTLSPIRDREAKMAGTAIAVRPKIHEPACPRDVRSPRPRCIPAEVTHTSLSDSGRVELTGSLLSGGDSRGLNEFAPLSIPLRRQSDLSSGSHGSFVGHGRPPQFERECTLDAWRRILFFFRVTGSWWGWLSRSCSPTAAPRAAPRKHLAGPTQF